MRKSIAGALVLAAACGGGTRSNPDAPAPTVDGMVDAPPPPPYWSPRPGDAKNWDVQLAAPIDTSAPRTMYMLDLWALVPSAMTLDYGDGDPVAVPAGAQAGTIAALHATSPSTIVICRIDTGALELGRPDARKFPGFVKGMKSCPTTITTGSVIGKTATELGECWLDITAANVGSWKAIMFERLDLAKAIGCDGVVGDRNDMAGSDTGFTIAAADQLAWYADVATATHARTLSAGMKDSEEIPGFLDQLAPDFEWFVIQRCAEYDDCDLARPFINLHEDVLAIDYQIDNSDPQNPTGIDPVVGCPRQETAMISDGLVKDGALSSAYRYQCTP